MSWYKMQRGWQDSSFFKDEPFTERDAWIWIIGEARFKECIFSSPSGKPIKVDRGQLYSSIRFMAEKFKWSKDRVLRYLKRLEEWSMINVENATGQNLITICNYKEYQGSDDSIEDTHKDTHKDALKDKQEEGKESKEVKKDNIILSDKFKKPTVEEIKAYCKERKNSVNENKFYDYYESIDWKVGKNKMKNWKACVRTWEQNSQSKNNNNGLSKSYGSDIPL